MYGFYVFIGYNKNKVMIWLFFQDISGTEDRKILDNITYKLNQIESTLNKDSLSSPLVSYSSHFINIISLLLILVHELESASFMFRIISRYSTYCFVYCIGP